MASKGLCQYDSAASPGWLHGRLHRGYGRQHRLHGPGWTARPGTARQGVLAQACRATDGLKGTPGAGMTMHLLKSRKTNSKPCSANLKMPSVRHHCLHIATRYQRCGFSCNTFSMTICIGGEGVPTMPSMSLQGAQDWCCAPARLGLRKRHRTCGSSHRAVHSLLTVPRR